jgi:hypothetical protein
MNTDTIIQLLLALSTIIGGAIAAYATYRSTNASVKNEELRAQIDQQRADKEDKGFGIEGAERISSIALANAQFMQQQFSECILHKNQLEEEVAKLTIQNTQYQVKQMRMVNKLRALAETHRKLRQESGLDCPGYDVLQSLLEQTATELEQEAMLQ